MFIVLFMFMVLVYVHCTSIAVFVLVYVHCTICAVLCDVVKCMCGFLVECMFFCKHCHRAKAQLQLNKYIYIKLHNSFRLSVSIETKVNLVYV
jgi:hypothetical protein